MKRPVIGLVPLWDAQKQSYWMLPGYLKGIEQAGGLPVMLPMTADPEQLAQLVELLDGFLFTGGQDVAPSLYGAEAMPWCGEVCEARDAMEYALLPLVLKADKPFFGICRGIQLINTVLGGTLYQDLPTEHPSTTDHHQTIPYDQPIHQVRLTPSSPLEDLLGCPTLAVNSLHHQAILKLAPDLKPMAVSEDGLVEAVYVPAARFGWAVQWHPEFNYPVEESSRKLFSAFVEACRRNDG